MAAVTQISLLSFSNLADTVARRYAQWPELVPGLEEAKSLFMVENVPRGTGSQRIYQEMDGSTFARYKSEGADATKVSVIKGYDKTMYARRFAGEISITAEARMFGNDQAIIRKMTDLARFIPQRQLLDLTHRFTFMTSTAYTDMDGESVNISCGDTLALVSASHTTTSGTPSTYSNVVTGNPTFSAGSLDIARNQANIYTVNNMGDRRMMNFNTVVTGDDSATVRAVKELLNSTGAPDGAHSGVANIDKAMFRHVILHYMATTATGAYDSTKTKYWAWVAAGEWEAHLGIWENPTLKTPDEDVHSDDVTFGTRGTYGICVVSPKGFVGSTGLGS